MEWNGMEWNEMESTRLQWNAPELKIRLADDSAETLGGRSTLVIVPNK